MPDEHNDFRPSDIPHNVVIQEALAPHLGGFEQAETAARAAYEALVVTYRRVIVEAEELAAHEEERRQLRNAFELAEELRKAAVADARSWRERAEMAVRGPR